MNRYQYKPANRHKALLLSLILPITLLVILGLAARPGSAENEATFTMYLPNVGFKYSSSPDRMLAAVSSDDVGNPVPPVIESITTVPAEPLVSVNSPIDFTSVFTDPSIINDSFTAYWEWGDGSFTTQYNVVSPIRASHVYTDPSIYTVALIVTDSDGLSDTASFEYLVVYDPSGGFVSGGGWIDSPDGAYQPDPSITGKATFGFISKYKKGATAPTGNTEFQFKTANLNFHSDSYDFLVVAGHKALFKGVGTINGSGNYGFMISAIDENLTPSTDVDHFRIKIWDKDDGDALVYDNQVACLATGDDADPCTPIGGGSIVIHKGK